MAMKKKMAAILKEFFQKELGINLLVDGYIDHPFQINLIGIYNKFAVIIFPDYFDVHIIGPNGDNDKVKCFEFNDKGEFDKQEVLFFVELHRE